MPLSCLNLYLLPVPFISYLSLVRRHRSVGVAAEERGGLPLLEVALAAEKSTEKGASESYPAVLSSLSFLALK